MELSVEDVLKAANGRVANAGSLARPLPEIRIDRLVSLGQAKSSDLAFFFSRAFEEELSSADPGILVIGEAFAQPLEAAELPLWKTAAIIACQDPYLVMATLSERFADTKMLMAHATPSSRTSPRLPVSTVHPTAVIHPTAEIGEGVQIGPHCVVEAQVRIGSGSILYPSCFVGPDCRLGEGCVLFPRVVLYERTFLGDRVRIHAGTVIGSDGFGYAPQLDQKRVVGHQKIFHLGSVLIGNDVEIGANCTVDRATLGETRIENSAKLDNLVHVGHNAQVLEGAVICGGTCLAGNAVIGRYAYVGGLSGIANHVHIGDGAKVGAVSLATKDVEPGGTAVGNPQRSHKEHFRVHALLSRLLAERRK